MLGFLDYAVIGGGVAIAAFLLFNMAKEAFQNKEKI